MLFFSSSQMFNRMKFVIACPTRLHTKDLNTVLQQVTYSDWLFLCYLAKNMEPFAFQQFLTELAVEYDEKKAGQFSTVSRDGKLNREKSP